MVVLTALYFLATVAYVVVSCRQWRILRDTLGMTAAVQRARLFINRIDFDLVASPAYSTLVISIRNAGALPAFDVKGRAQSQHREPPHQRYSRSDGASVIAGAEPCEHRFLVDVSAADRDAVMGEKTTFGIDVEIAYTSPPNTRGSTRVRVTVGGPDRWVEFDYVEVR